METRASARNNEEPSTPVGWLVFGGGSPMVLHCTSRESGEMQDTRVAFY